MTSERPGNGMSDPKVEEDAVHRVMAASLPQVLSCILNHLPVADVCRVSTVCREWNKLANENQLWKCLCDRDGIIQEQLKLTLNQMDLHRWCYYKCVYKKYATVMKRWMSGEGMTTFTKTLLRPSNGYDNMIIVVVSSSYILARGRFWEWPRDTDIYVYSALAGEYSHKLSGLTGHPDGVLLSDDELMVAAYGRESRVVCVWNGQTAECLHSLDHPHDVQTIAMHKTRLAVSFSGGIFVWNVQNGQSLHQLVGPTNPVLMVLDFDYLAVSICNDDLLHLWNITTGAHLFTCNQMDRPKDKIYHSILLDSGTHSVIWFVGDRWNVWDTETGACRAVIYADHNYDDVYDEDTVIIYTSDGNAAQSDLHFDDQVQDGKLIICIRSLQNDGIYCPSILVMDLKSSSILYRTNCCTVELLGNSYTRCLLKTVSNLPGYILMYCEGSASNETPYLYDVKRGRFVREVNVGLEQGKKMHHTMLNASFKTLQKFDFMNGLTYVRYNFDL